jgi:hypothetical protein
MATEAPSKRRGRPPRTPRPEVEAAVEDLTAPATKGRGKNNGAGEVARIDLPELKIQTMRITLIGDSSLICHAWSHKAKSQMLAKQMKQAKQGKEAKNPEQDFRDSLYPHPDGGYGFPAVAFKSAAVDACSHVQGVTKVEARGAFHINGELIKIESAEPTPREDMVRIAMGTADIRYRGEFKTWRAEIELRYNVNVLSPAQIVNLFNTAGFAIGIGEWRPQKDGSHGMFHVQREDET